MHGFWQEKDSGDNLPHEALEEFDFGYPRDKALFQAPHPELVFQNNALAFDAGLTQLTALIDGLNALRVVSR